MFLNNIKLSFDLKVLLTAMLLVFCVGMMLLTAQTMWLAAYLTDFPALLPVAMCLGTVFVMVGSIDIITLMWTPRPRADSE